MGIRGSHFMLFAFSFLLFGNLLTIINWGLNSSTYGMLSSQGSSNGISFLQTLSNTPSLNMWWSEFQWQLCSGGHLIMLRMSGAKHQAAVCACRVWQLTPKHFAMLCQFILRNTKWESESTEILYGGLPWCPVITDGGNSAYLFSVCFIYFTYFILTYVSSHQKVKTSIRR